MILSTIMDSIAKLRKRIANLDNVCGYIIKVNNGRYFIFESKVHYKIINYLEKMAFDSVNQVLTCEVDEYMDFIILAHMTTIENYLKSFPLSKIDVKSFDLFSRSEGREGYVTPFEAKFPTLDYFFKTFYLFDEEYSNYKIFIKRLKTEEVEERFRNLKEEVNQFVGIEYIKIFCLILKLI